MKSPIHTKIGNWLPPKMADGKALAVKRIKVIAASCRHLAAKNKSAIIKGVISCRQMPSLCRHGISILAVKLSSLRRADGGGKRKAVV